MGSRLQLQRRRTHYAPVSQIPSEGVDCIVDARAHLLSFLTIDDDVAAASPNCVFARPSPSDARQEKGIAFFLISLGSRSHHMTLNLISVVVGLSDS